MLVIGLTGGICSGKTTVSNEFSRLGVKIIDADEISRQLLANSLYSQPSPALLQIAEHFGKHIFDNEGFLIRRELKEIIFTGANADKNKKTLETIIHPLVYQQMTSQIEQFKNASSSPAYIIVSVPLLVETARFNLYDRILVVDIEHKEQIKRCLKRDNLSIDSIKKIIKSQVSREKRLSHADDVINNHLSIEELTTMVARLHKSYLQLSDTNKQ